MQSRLLPTLLAALLLTACGGGGDGGSGEPANTTDNCANFTSQLAIFDQFSQPANQFMQGENIRFRFSITNRSDQEQALSSGACTNDVLGVQDTRGRMVWDRDFDTRCTVYIGDRRFQPGETVQFNYLWDQRDNSGARIEPGTYKAYASIGGGCRDPLFKEAGFHVQ